MEKKYYLKERFNPQFDKPYYVALGQITKLQAKKAENSRYGTNVIHSYETKEEYIDAIEKFKQQDFNIH